MTLAQQRVVNRKVKILEEGKKSGNVSQTCRYFGISRETFYQWKRASEIKGQEGLINSRPCPINLKRRVLPEIEEKILHLRRTYHFGALRISWYLARYHDFKVSEGGVRGVLFRNGLSRLPKNAKRRSPGPFQMYSKQVPGHHVQIDVKFLFFTDKENRRLKRFQYTAIDDATRVRALKIFEKHTQENAIQFLDHVIKVFPFRIKQIRTDNGHEFQAQFHWHALDCGLEHHYIKKGTPRLNGKVERSHRTDQEEFYQLLEYKGDQDLEEKVKVWEQFYNLHRPHSYHHGQTPYEVLRERLWKK